MNRVFFALPLPATALPVLERVQHELRPVAAPLAPRWTRPEQMHVTLKFLGDQPDQALPRLVDALRARAAGARPFAASLSRVEAFGGRRARVLVALLETATPALVELAAGLESDAEALGVARESRPFCAHVTLARLEHPGDARAVIAAAKLERRSLTLSSICLYRSQLSAGGSRYDVLERCDLGG